MASIAEEKLRAARAKAAFVRPYFAHALYALILVEQEHCPTMAVDTYGRLYYGPDFVLEKTLEELATVFIHEIGHVLRDHAKRARALGVTWLTHQIANIAEDCFPAGTMLSDGHPIEKPRSETLSGNGATVDCTNLERPWDGEVVTIKGHGVELTCTPEHPVWVYRGIRHRRRARAPALRRAHQAAYPRRHKYGLTPVRLADPRWVKASEARFGDFLLVPNVGSSFEATTIDMNPFGGNENRSPLKSGFPLNEQTAWLLGIYTAEGSGTENACLSLGAHEQPLIDRAMTIAASLGYSPACYDVVDAEAVQVYLGSRVLARALGRWCGRGAKNKRVPDFILRHADTRLVRAYLEGLSDGDGWHRTGTIQYIQLSTSSRALVSQVRLLLARLDLGFSGDTSIQRRRKIKGRVLEGGSKLHNIRWRWEPGVSTRVLNGKTVKSWSRSWRRCDEGILIPIKTIERSHYTGPVYNLSCDGDHTFIAEGVKVHNCELNDDLAEEVKTLGDLAPLPGPTQAQLEKIARRLAVASGVNPDTFRVTDIPEKTLGPVYPWKIDCEDDKVWEVYYGELMDRINDIDVYVIGAGDCGGSGSGTITEGGKTLRIHVHQCGSGAHNVKMPWEDEEPAMSGTEGVSAADWSDIKRLTAEAITEHQRSRGNVPGGWKAWADDLLKPRRIPWDQVLAGELRWSIDDVAGAVFHSYKRPSRRQSAVPNIIFPTLRRHVPFVCFVADTSGSMDDVHDLPLVRGVVQDICYSLGARIAFLATDAEVHGGIQTVHDGRSVELLGRGGTNMAVGIDYALKNLRPRPDVIVVGTDCATPWPAADPGVRVVVCAINATAADLAAIPEWAKVVIVDAAETSRKVKEEVA